MPTIIFLRRFSTILEVDFVFIGLLTCGGIYGIATKIKFILAKRYDSCFPPSVR
jgi:hypothetical protein